MSKGPVNAWYPEIPEKLPEFEYFSDAHEVTHQVGWIPLHGFEWGVFRKEPGYTYPEAKFVCICRDAETAAMLVSLLNAEWQKEKKRLGS